jgi:hypothetical protein
LSADEIPLLESNPDHLEGETGKTANQRSWYSLTSFKTFLTHAKVLDKKDILRFSFKQTHPLLCHFEKDLRLHNEGKIGTFILNSYHAARADETEGKSEDEL